MSAAEIAETAIILLFLAIVILALWKAIGRYEQRIARFSGRPFVGEQVDPDDFA